MTEQSTTPDPLELARRLTDAAGGRDVDAAISFYVPHAVFDVRESFRAFEGRLAIRGLFEEWLGAYDEWQFETEERRDLGNGVTFSVWLQRGRPKGSAGCVHTRGAFVNTWVDGLVERSTNYLDIDKARAAAERLAQERG
jgi:hypothetical protein